MSIEDHVRRACNKLAKWRSVFAGWQLGTRPITDPECQAVRDHREVTMLMRAELSALTALLIKHHYFTQSQFQIQLIDEVEALDKMYEHKFPGFSTTDEGVNMKMPQAGETTKGWRQ